MIKRSKQFDLGLDMTRMKGRSDGQRQSATVDEILDRFFNQKEGRRRDIQILADEVGMGKTYIALGVVAMLRYFNPMLRVLYICPSRNVQEKWDREYKSFIRTFFARQ